MPFTSAINPKLYENLLLIANHKPCQVDSTLQQGRSQDIADARAQHGHTTFVRNSAQSAEAFRRSGTISVSIRGERMRLEFCGYIYIALLRRSISRPFSA